MPRRVGRLARHFGSGPLGGLLSGLLLVAAFLARDHLGLPPIMENAVLRNRLAGLAGVLALSLFAWSHAALPPSARGQRLCTTGPYRYVRHPLYAGLLYLVSLGLALFLNNCVFLLWAVLLHPLWHQVIRYEERLMVDLFGDEYREYQKRTGRFFPRLWL
jgi:protein-S-isoprenylcysteine O-methyltransferase Ste14